MVWTDQSAEAIDRRSANRRPPTDAKSRMTGCAGKPRVAALQNLLLLLLSLAQQFLGQNTHFNLLKSTLCRGLSVSYTFYATMSIYAPRRWRRRRPAQVTFSPTPLSPKSQQPLDPSLQSKHSNVALLAVNADI